MNGGAEGAEERLCAAEYLDAIAGVCQVDISRLRRGMSISVAVRCSQRERDLIDELVRLGVGPNRSAVIRESLAEMAAASKPRAEGAAIAASYRERPQSEEDRAAAVAHALALTDAEPW